MRGGRGPWGGPAFSGNQRGGMFGDHSHPMPGFRGRDGMNMSHMVPRHQGLHPMDRRMDGPPMRGHDMDPQDMRGREPNQEFFRPVEETDFVIRRHVEISIREKITNTSDFPGPGRDVRDMGGRDMPPWGSNNRFSDMRDIDSFDDMPRFNRPNFDDGRGFPVDRMEPNYGFREMHGRNPVGIHDTDRNDMEFFPHERRKIEFDGRGEPPFNPSRFDSDTDFRNQPGPAVEFQGRSRSPLRLGRGDEPPVDKGRSDMPYNAVGPRQSEFMDSEDGVRSKPYPDSGGSPVMDYRSGDEMTLAEEWKNRRKDKTPFPDPFHDRNKPPVGFQGKDASFTSSDPFPAMDAPPVGSKSPQHHLPALTVQLDGDNENWLDKRDPNYIYNKPNHDERSPYQGKNEPVREIQIPSDSIKEATNILRGQVPSRNEFGNEQNVLRSSSIEAKDQDYRDIDYRTGPARVFDYKHEDLPPKLLEDSKSIAPSAFTDSAFTDSGSQDQDYRKASVKNKVSNIISIVDIPKTTTVDQILGSFAVRDGVPMQGIKIRDVVPGYSYDMAYVEFLNLKDAVYFMESNKGSLKLGNKEASMKYVQPNEYQLDVFESDPKVPQLQDSHLHRLDGPSNQNHPLEQLSHGPWQHSSNLTPEIWQQKGDQHLQKEEETEKQGNSTEIKTMVLLNLSPTVTVEDILKGLDPFAYLDERNLRLVKTKSPGKNNFCFVDMDSYEQVTRLVEILQIYPLYIDGVKVRAEIERKPLKNPNVKRGYEKSHALIPGHTSEADIVLPHPQPPQHFPHLVPPAVAPTAMPGDFMTVQPAMPSDPALSKGVAYEEVPAAAPPVAHAAAQECQPDVHVPTDSSEVAATTDVSQTYVYGSEIPDTSKYMYDSTSGFFYDPETTLYFDPNSRYFYNSQTQEYLYWDAALKTYIPVPEGNSAETQQPVMTPKDQAILSNPAADAPLELKKPPQSLAAPTPAPAAVSADSAAESIPAPTVAPDNKEEDELPKRDKEKDGKEDKTKSPASVKIRKDMERWAKIQNRQKDCVRASSPVLKPETEAEKRQKSKSADAAFAIFERKASGGDGLFKKPLSLSKKEDKSKQPMGSLSLLASDYGAGSDEEVEEDKEEAAKTSQKSQPKENEKEDKLTDLKKMACLLCRRQFPNKDALTRHQELSDLHKQNMEIHLKIKRSKKELEALEKKEKELNHRGATKSPDQKRRSPEQKRRSPEQKRRSPEQKRRKHHHQQSRHQNNWSGSSRSRDSKVSERPGLGTEPVKVPDKKHDHTPWDPHTYKQAVRKAMFARYKELE